MKIFRKAQSKILVILTALLASSVCAASGLGVMNAQAEAQTGVQADAGMTCTDTEVQDIAYSQHPSIVYLGFRLTESDYDDYAYIAGRYLDRVFPTQKTLLDEAGKKANEDVKLQAVKKAIIKNLFI